MRFILLSLGLIATMMINFSLALALGGYEDVFARGLSGELPDESPSPDTSLDYLANNSPRYDEETRFRINPDDSKFQ